MTFIIKHRQNSLLAKVERVVIECGPMTRAQIAQESGVPFKTFGGLFARLIRQSGPLSPQRMHVVDWTSEHEGSRSYPRAIYALGPGVNKPKPKPLSHRQRTRKYYAKASRTVTSVFDLGLKAHERIARAALLKGLA